MARGVIEIIGNIKSLLEESALVREITGEIYSFGERPDFSVKEDIVLHHKSGGIGSLQEGVVHMLIYTCDNLSVSGYSKNMARLTTLEPLASEWVEVVNSYATSCRLTLREPIEVMSESEIGQHYICLALNYKLFSSVG